MLLQNFDFEIELISKYYDDIDYILAIQQLHGYYFWMNQWFCTLYEHK